jgi:predicted Zn-dependent protease with MMP-like domain
LTSWASFAAAGLLSAARPRTPLLDFWCDGEDSLDEVVTHVLVHEIGHHFGLSDADMEAIEEKAR